MKKILAISLLVVMMLSLVACGGGSEAPAGNGGSEQPAAGDDVIVIRLGTATEPDGHYVLGAKMFEEKVEEYTEGKVDVQIFPSSQLGNERDLIEGLSLGTLEMTVSSTGPLPNFSKDFMLFDLPFIVTDREAAYEVMDGEVGQEILASLEPIGIKGLGFWENGFRNLSNSKREVLTPEDVKGLKIRTMENPVHIASFELLGATPTPMAWGEVFTSLQQGTIDGQENPLVIFDTNKLHEAQDYLSLTGHFYSPAVMMISLDAFNSYPADVQDAIVRAEKEARDWERAYSKQMDEELVEVIEANGVTVSEVDKQLWQDAFAPIYEKFSDQINPEYIDALLGK
ncbi:TRAP transporter substrate-binding protein [Gudongella sp. SC589]|jgi:tripartite ATP-independent transporter DctP family solute receptor|uniref:TRAP transporter substrate-binding protein n=1 Tax=Gudongella sp. SC589 TaxID=3385990 RepID=UPI0039047A6C